MRTIFNTDRVTRSRAQLASSEYALVTVGGRSELGQSVQGSYNRQIQTIFEIGNPAITWLAGHEQGNMTFQRLVGNRGFFDGWEGDECGVITPVSINLGGGPCVAVAAGGLRFDNAMIEGLNWSITAGTLEIMEGVSMRIGSMGRA
jgi:hypothetical protein